MNFYFNRLWAQPEFTACDDDYICAVGDDSDDEVEVVIQQLKITIIFVEIFGINNIMEKIT